MSFDYYQSVIGKMRKGTTDDSFIDVNETLQVVNSKVVLSEIPDKFNGLVVKTVFGNTTLVEIKKGTPTDNQYLCDYNLGVVHFPETVNGERYVFSYKGRGSVYLAAERIYTKQMNSNEIIQTLRDILDEADSIINLSERFTNTGEYSVAEVYYGRNIVTYDNAAYMCINHSADGIINIPPTNTSHWMQMVSVKQAVEAANSAASSANTAATNANTATTNANNAADYANEQGDYAKGIRDNFGHKGDYSPTATYKNGNVVTYGGINYFCIQDTTAGIDPLNGAYWTVVSPQASINDQTWTAIEGQTVFTITNGNYVPDQGNIEVLVGGVPQVSGVGYTETNNTTITLSEGVTAGTTVFAKWYEGHMSITKGHKSSHALGGQDEIDLTQMRNYKEKVSDEFVRVDAQLADNVTQINNRHSKFAMGTMSLKDEFYGLTGDASVDASDVIEDILLSLPTSGGKILVPEGDFKITRPLTVGATGQRWNIVFQGQAGPSGYEGSRFISDVPNIVMFNVLGHGVEFQKVGFKGDGSLVRGYDATITALKVGDGTAIPDDFTVDGCIFFRLKRGVHALTRNYYIRNNTFGHIQQYGIYMDGLTQTTEANSGFGEDYNNRDNIIAFNRFHGLTGDAIYGRLTTVHKEVDISHNLIDDVSRGIVGAFIRSKINSNTLGRIRSHGIYVDNTGYDESVEIDGNTIVGISGNLPGDAVAPATNAFNYETGNGIHVTSKSAKINNNTVMHKAHNGIWIGAGSEGTQVNDNTVINADNYNTATYDAITNASNNVTFDGNIMKRTTSIGKHRHALNNSGGGCYFGAGNQYGSSSGSKVFNDTSVSSVGYASNLGMYRKLLYGGANPSVTANLQKGDRWINVLATNAGEVTEYQFNGTAWKPINTLGA